MPQKNIVGILHAGTSIESSQFGINLAKKYDFAYTSIGIHPEEVENLQADYLEILENMAKNNEKVVAIGEIGLDYHWTKETKNKQIEVLENQLKLAQKLNLPVIIHMREATADCMEILKKYKPRGVMHCFSGSVETAKDVLNLGFYISFTGVLTFSNAKNSIDVLKNIPMERLLLETDAPYMSPAPERGKRCTSDLIRHIIAKIAETKNISAEEVAEICLENTKRLFNI